MEIVNCKFHGITKWALGAWIYCFVCADQKHQQIVQFAWKFKIRNVEIVQIFGGCFRQI